MIEKATMQKIVDEQDYKLLAKELIAAKQLIDDGPGQEIPRPRFRQGLARRDQPKDRPQLQRRLRPCPMRDQTGDASS